MTLQILWLADFYLSNDFGWLLEKFIQKNLGINKVYCEDKVFNQMKN